MLSSGLCKTRSRASIPASTRRTKVSLRYGARTIARRAFWQLVVVRCVVFLTRERKKPRMAAIPDALPG